MMAVSECVTSLLPWQCSYRPISGKRACFRWSKAILIWQGAVSVLTGKTQRIRDPIHGLIVFETDQAMDQLAWQLINAREFQRLRRVRQLGFSELVFPGASHTRFSHCIGVFHTARH